MYWAVGVMRLIAFRSRLARENRRHESGNFANLPPPMLRYRVHGALDPESYVNAGRVLAARLREALRGAGLDDRNASVLDFACGPGRIAAEIKAMQPEWRLIGSDIDKDAIAWAQEHLSGVADFQVNPQDPPAPFESNSFDAVYSVSLFTHLDEGAQLSWLSELRRVLRPEGLALVTTHGAPTFHNCSAEELAQIDRHGFAFRVDRKGWLKLDGLPDSYQTTFHTKAYVERVWGALFDIVSFREGALEGHQDLVILRKRSGV